jgi:peptide/nickel transport system permease protein
MAMTRFIVRRARDGAISLLGIVLLVFFLARLTGSPARLYLPENASPAQIDAFNEAHGFNSPLYSQLWHFLGGVVHFDFGESLIYERSSMSVVMDRYPATLTLAATSMLFASVIGLLLGAVAAAKRNSVFDGASRITSLIALSAPDFWVGITGITVFAVTFDLLPTSGKGGWQYWVLPLVTLGLRPIGVLAQIVRTSMITALDSDYVRVAKAKGVGPGSIVFKHALRNAALPILTVAGVLTAQLINGALVVETVFGWPGVGSLMVDAIKRRDFAVIQAIVLFTGAVIIVLNFLIDLTYSWMNPQVKLGR